MPLLADRVKETTTTTGTGTISLAGAPAGFQSFNTAFANASLVYYVIQGGAEWEIGIGTVGTGTLARTQVLQSSNADALVPFSAGVKDVFCSYVADRAVTTVDAATLTNKTIDDYTNNVGANSTHFRIKAGATLAKGDVVKASGFTPGEAAIEVVKTASATDVAIGIVEQALTTGQFGTAVVIGELFDVNTNGLSVGATLYQNGAGGFTTTRPASGLFQAIGWVVRANTSNGVIAVNIVNPQYVEASTNTANTLVLRDGSGNFSAGTITATLSGTATQVSQALTAGTYLTSGGTYDGSTARTFAVDATSTNTASKVVVRDGSGNFAAGTITAALSGNATTATTADKVANALTGGTYITSTGTFDGSAARTFAVDATSTNTASKVVARDASGNFSAGTITAALSGNASTATALQTARNINGVAFNGTADITVAAAAGTLTGTTLASNVVSSSLTSVGTLANLTVTNPITGSVTGAAGSVAAANITGTTLASNVTGSSLTSVGTLTGLTVSGNANLSTVSGNVGVGTASPGAKLELQSSGSGTELRLRSTDTTSANIRAYVNSLEAGKLEFTSARALNIETAGSLRASIDANGNLAVDTNTLYVDAVNNRVGVGTASPQRRFNAVVDYTASTIVPAIKIATVGGYNSGSGTAIDFGQDQGTYTTWVTGRIASPRTGSNYGGSLTFFTNDDSAEAAIVERMRLDTSGNLGLGVTPSAWSGSYVAMQVGASASVFGSKTGEAAIVQSNGFLSATGYKYILSAPATQYSQGNGVHSWFTAPSGTAGNAITFTQAMTLDASGNLNLGQATSALQSGGTGVTVYGSSASEIKFLNSTSGTAATDGTALVLSSSDFNINNRESGAILFGTANTERARITSGGYFKASDAGTYGNATGTYHEVRSSSTDTFAVNIANTAASPYGIYLDFSSASPDNNTNYFLRCLDSTTSRCFIYSDGDLANHDGVYGTISDAALKQDIIDATSQWADIKAVRFRKYRMKTDVAADANAPYQLGVIAQELEATSPGLVDEHPNEDGTTTKTVKSSILLMKAAVALQEAMARIETLEQRVLALEA